MIRVGQPDLFGKEIAYVTLALRKGRVTQGPFVQQFEKMVAKYLGVKHAIATSSGATALHLALLSVGVSPGDKVIVPSLTYVASVNAIRMCGAEPVFADVESASWCISSRTVAQVWQRGIKAILPVHLYGYPVDITSLRTFGVPIVEDAAEALGAKSNGAYCGTIGDVGILSFYGNKTITTGEGGMVLTNNDDLAAKIRKMRGQGQSLTRRYWHECMGYNYRMTDVQAAIGCAQMERIGDFLEIRRRIAQFYRAWMPGLSFQTGLSNGSVHGHWATVGLLPRGINRDAVRQLLHDRGIETRPAFYPVHTMPMYATGSTLPMTEEVSMRGVMFPLHTQLGMHQVRHVCDAVREIVESVKEHA